MKLKQLAAKLRSALAGLDKAALLFLSKAPTADRGNPRVALGAFRDAAREVIATDLKAVETFFACAEILSAELEAQR